MKRVVVTGLGLLTSIGNNIEDSWKNLINLNSGIKKINIVDLVISSKLLTSKGEVRRAINNRGIKVNNETIESDKENISTNNFNNENYLKLSHGKKKHVIIKMI